MRARGRFPAVLLGLAPLVAAQGAGSQEPATPPPDATVADGIRLLLEQRRAMDELHVAGVEIGGEDLYALYEPHDFAPLWSPASTRDLAGFVRTLGSDGLEPDDYGLPLLTRIEAGTADLDAAARDVVLSQLLLRVATHLRRGAVDPGTLGAAWAGTPREPPVPADSLRAFVTGGALGRRLAGLRPDHFIYRGLVNALAHYRGIAERGGWTPVGPGPLLGPDSVSDRVPALRRRLVRTGDLLAGADTTSRRYDPEVEAAVKRFQHRHGLNDDGLVGESTGAALDVPVEERIRQLRLNLERARWVAHGLGGRVVTVNIAGQRIYVLDGEEVAWESRVVVGQPYTRTPVFRGDMRYLVLNPTWTVPRSINREILARWRREPGYLAAEGFEILDGAGARVDPATVDPSAHTGWTFPWVFRQRPGPTNALGRVKFMFPNPYSVYLHDTPARYLFAREERTFSHGCIRVEDPLRLAELLLAGQGGPDRAGLQALLADGQTRTVHLETPLPVLVLYWTASTDLHGEVHFYRDVYERDAPLARALGLTG